MTFNCYVFSSAPEAKFEKRVSIRHLTIGDSDAFLAAVAFWRAVGCRDYFLNLKILPK